MYRRLSALIATLCLAGCTSLFFHPQPSHVRTPAQIGLQYEDITLSAADGVRLHAWFLPAQTPPRGTILFLHGNAENISTHIGSVYWLPERGFNVLLLDYRGYGRSEGHPELRGMVADVEAAMNTLLTRSDVDASRIVVFGQSLGGAIALHYVAHSKHRKYIRALVIDSAFASYRGITREKMASLWFAWPFQWLPWLTVTGQYDPADAVARISPIPLLVIHGGRDTIVPATHAETLYARAREPKELWMVPAGGHIDAFRFEECRDRFVAYLADKLGERHERAADGCAN